MYFKNRADAGRQLAKKLLRYRTSNVAVVALSRGSMIIGAQVAMKLHGSLSMLLTRDILLPGEHEAIAAVSSAGTYTQNHGFSAGELEQLTMDYRSFIEEARREAMHEMNMLVSHDGEIKKDYLRNHVVVVVADGFQNGFSLDVVADYFKTIAIKKLVVATPVASVKAVDRMHLVADEICCLDVKPNFIGIDHYYDENTIPSNIEGLLKVQKHISLNWKIEPIVNR